MHTHSPTPLCIVDTHTYDAHTPSVYDIHTDRNLVWSLTDIFHTRHTLIVQSYNTSTHPPMTCVHLHCIYQTMDPMNMPNTTHNHCTSSLHLHMTTRPHMHRTMPYTYQTPHLSTHRHNACAPMYIVPTVTCGTRTIHHTHASHTIYPHTDIPPTSCVLTVHIHTNPTTNCTHVHYQCIKTCMYMHSW